MSKDELERYNPGQVQLALQQLARNGGDVEKTANELINDEFMVPAAALFLWKTETHAEQYKRFEHLVGAEQERIAVATAQEIVRRGGVWKLELMEEIAKIRRQELMPQALRAISDATHKGAKELLALTGRPVDGRANDASVESMTRLVEGLAQRGLLKINERVAVTLEEGRDFTEDGG